MIDGPIIDHTRAQSAVALPASGVFRVIMKRTMKETVTMLNQQYVKN
ncbi:hypothetical protein KCP75_24870 [Salmonella enterica subsp. enterica]|nr:hypothetical protein KCP75_24870 [Salmonella enterica subsp. enterica]